MHDLVPYGESFVAITGEFEAPERCRTLNEYGGRCNEDVMYDSEGGCCLRHEIEDWQENARDEMRTFALAVTGEDKELVRCSFNSLLWDVCEVIHLQQNRERGWVGWTEREDVGRGRRRG